MKADEAPAGTTVRIGTELHAVKVGRRWMYVHNGHDAYDDVHRLGYDAVLPVTTKPALTGPPVHGRAPAGTPLAEVLTACGQDRANVQRWTETASEVTCKPCLVTINMAAQDRKPAAVPLTDQDRNHASDVNGVMLFHELAVGRIVADHLEAARASAGQAVENQYTIPNYSGGVERTYLPPGRIVAANPAPGYTSETHAADGMSVTKVTPLPHHVALSNGRDDVVCSCGDQFTSSLNFPDASLQRRASAITYWAEHYRETLKDGPLMFSQGDMAECWDRCATETAEWMANNPGASGIPSDPPRNPYEEH